MAADAAKRNSFRAAKNQKIASDFLIFCRSIKFYLPPQAAIRLMRLPQQRFSTELDSLRKLSVASMHDSASAGCKPASAEVQFQWSLEPSR
jgi:hypothetical protein